MKKLLMLFLIGLSLISFVGCANEEQKTITAFCGSASKPAIEEAAKAFEEKTGIKVELNFGGSGTMLSQMKLSKSGDLYIPGSPDYMVKAKKDGIIDHNTVKIDPETVCVGLYAYEILEYNNLLGEVQKNKTIVTYAESCSKTASLVALKSVDAILGWRVFSVWHPDTIDVVYLKPEQLPRLAYVPGAISTFTKDRESSQKFLDFLISQEGQEIFNKWGYIATEKEARKFAPNAEIGGEYILPETYEPLIK